LPLISSSVCAEKYDSPQLGHDHIGIASTTSLLIGGDKTGDDRWYPSLFYQPNSTEYLALKVDHPAQWRPFQPSAKWSKKAFLT